MIYTLDGIVFIFHSDSVDKAEVYRIDNARENLIFKINAGIDNEMITIDYDMQTLKNLYLDLKNKFHYLITLKNKVPESDPLMHALIKGTTYRPELASLYEYAERIYDYYNHFFNLINHNYIVLNRYDERTIQNLIVSMEKSSDRKDQILKVLILTEFMTKEKIIK
ncbi:hypothetical protein PV327_001607 [Microctonus hyperodae]|uniref:Uncharacterized protein n=1 Tax=Microctonus hyperodae TaxID=165561 RepID=A0AA39KNA7_MICHY|nr:hypothetical protein PV327_001607 [Microctonus hyperodae]